MTDTVLLSDGKIDIASLERHLARRSLTVDGVCPTRNRLLRWLGLGGTPRVRAWTDGAGRIHLRAGIAAQFGYDVFDLAERVQQALRDQATRLTQRDVLGVQVRVVKVVATRDTVREVQGALPGPKLH